MTAVRNVYRVVRSVLFTIVISVVLVFVLAYVALTIPGIHNKIRDAAERELTAFLDAPVHIGRVTVLPMNEVVLQDVEIRTPQGGECVSIDRLGAGIAFWKFVTGGGIEITYAELTGLRAGIEQRVKDGPLNIAFIIEAFRPKKKNRSPAKFDLKLHNVTIRKSSVAFARPWQPQKESGVLDPNHISVSSICADLAMPRLSNDDFEIDLKRLSFREQSGIYVDALSFRASVTPDLITLSNFKLDLDNASVRLNDQKLAIKGFKDIVPALRQSEHDIRLTVSDITAPDLAFLSPVIRTIPGKYNLQVEVNGLLDDMDIRQISLEDDAGLLNVSFRGNLQGLPEVRSLKGRVGDLHVDCDAGLAQDIISTFASLPDKAASIIESAGFLELDAQGDFSLDHRIAKIEGNVSTGHGGLDVDGLFGWNNGGLTAKVKAGTDGFDVGALVPGQSVGNVVAAVEGEVSVKGKMPEGINGKVNVDVASLTLSGKELRDIVVDATKEGQALTARISANCPYVEGEILADCVIDGTGSLWDLQGNIGTLDMMALGMTGKYQGIYGVEDIYVRLQGNNPDNMLGEARISGLECRQNDGTSWILNNFGVSMTGDSEQRRINVDSDVLDGEVRGHFSFAQLPKLFTGILAHSLPAYIKAPDTPPAGWNSLSYSLSLKPDENIYKALNLPVRPGAPVRIYGNADNDNIGMTVVAPYILKGDKLIKEINLSANAGIRSGISVHGGVNFPVKNQYVKINLNGGAFKNIVTATLDWIADNNLNNGTLRMGMEVSKDAMQSPVYTFRIKDSNVMINGETWEVRPMRAILSDRVLSVDDMNISHDDQFLKISGRASASPEDTLTVSLNDIDLSYIFNTLNINYVTFGGNASGRAVATQLFTRNPVANTQGLKVRNFSYNNALLGDADLRGFYDSQNKAVGIGANIYGDSPSKWTTVDGRIYIAGDSLRLNFDANRINLALIQPFLSNILDKVDGEASAKLSLFGTFKDISLTGKAFADTASVRLGFTGVTYHGSDSVFFYTDRIHIPGFRVYDRYGHSAMLDGDVRMRYFRNAYVNFFVRDIRDLLCYDLGQGSNPVWWGKVFASGTGSVIGQPGFTRISFDVRTEPNSTFTFALDETQVATDYNFLTFIDTSKKTVTETMSVEQEFENLYRGNAANDEDESGDFELDLAVSIDPSIKMNVIMDPSAGDKITATGTGSMRLNYNSFSDRMDLFGKYTIADGNYRFTFQDIIIRDFKIRNGSVISFNGDPMQGQLDLTAGYRVNTNLTDLDKSFATDRDLNRSSVPVEALIKVSGNLEHPLIGYDLSLPTVTGDVERKVRSIISSEEMMQQQVLYLLALNRFYTPQFSGTSDGELVSMASSTISSQVSNILSQMTDKISLNPSFKSDRNDFSDMEVDLALSSQLFDNRLIINGNLGYRDRSVSQTNFVGDFDIEYLLSKNGRLRLKAYNHFNDAYYYLKSALTTQGVGLIYRTDFDDPFKFLRRKSKKKSPKGKERAVRDVIRKEETVGSSTRNDMK